MKENKKSFSELTKSLQPLEENQEGMLKGGFASITSTTNILNPINAFACGAGHPNTNCSTGNCVASCGGTAPE